MIGLAISVQEYNMAIVLGGFRLGHPEGLELESIVDHRRLINQKGAIQDLAGTFDGRKIGSFLFEVKF